MRRIRTQASHVLILKLPINLGNVPSVKLKQKIHIIKNVKKYVKEFLSSLTN